MRPSSDWPGANSVLIAVVAACTQPPASPPSASAAKSSLAHGVAVDPANIKRVARDLPPGYEVTTGIPGAASPRVIWGLGEPM